MYQQNSMVFNYNQAISEKLLIHLIEFLILYVKIEKENGKKKITMNQFTKTPQNCTIILCGRYTTYVLPKKNVCPFFTRWISNNSRHGPKIAVTTKDSTIKEHSGFFDHLLFLLLIVNNWKVP